MELNDLLTNVSVVGAAGKMGSGIATLITQELVNLKLKFPEKRYQLNLIDVNETALDGLKSYIKTQLIKQAEKSIVALRESYKNRVDLVENGEIIDEYVNQGTMIIRVGSELALAQKSKLIFEAVIENENLKINILTQLKTLCSPDTVFLTNTSSIPIGFFEREAQLKGRIIGYHFYNPPMVQKLLEIISTVNTPAEFKKIADELGVRLGKKIIPANDIAGFIGNGHFIRDGLFALSEVNRLKDKYGIPEAIYIMNRITQDFLVRPMGIFQLIDYVGIDVFQLIMKVMNRHLPDPNIGSELINTLINKNIKGGQFADGSQKDGFIKYQEGKPTGIYDIHQERYVNLDEIKGKCDPIIGNLPPSNAPWKKLVKDSQKDKTLEVYFANMKKETTLGAELGQKYLGKSKAIAEKLISDGVAQRAEDVNTVLMNGFFWLYGPINHYI